MNLPLMPKATAMWLIQNTGLTFEQIADFCGMHILEVQSLADGEGGINIFEENPIMNGQLTKEEIERCENDHSARLKLAKINQIVVNASKKHHKYTPMARRQDKPDAIVWLLKHYPDITDSQIMKLLGTTKSTVSTIRGKEHWNTANIRPRDPVLLGLCSQGALNNVIQAIKPNVSADKKTIK